MRNQVSLTCALFVLLCFFATVTPAQEDMVVIDNSVFENPQRPPAVFKHDEHNELAQIEECNECHHVYEEGKRLEDESSEDQRCAECHELHDVGDKPGLVKAFHTNCKSCHREQKREPLMCGQCHVRSTAKF